MATYNVHAGHAKQGNKFSGASGFCNESVENRLIKDAVIKWLEADGHKAYDCTINSGTSASNIISQIKTKTNAHKATANISIHLNALEMSKSDGKTKGVECCVYASSGEAYKMGDRICRSVASLGFKNRGNKIRTNLAILKGISNGGANVLVECFFCDDQDDYKLYAVLGPDKVGKAIAEGIVGHEIKLTTKKEFKVKTKTPLNIRKGAGTSFTTVGVAPVSVYTIIETNGNWGKLKSGAGWISISPTYVDRL